MLESVKKTARLLIADLDVFAKFKIIELCVFVLPFVPENMIRDVVVMVAHMEMDAK
jgi:hypothetical protein